MRQTTIASSVELVGIGLHRGNPVNLRLDPLPEHSGIVFYRSDKGVSIVLASENVVDTKLATVIGANGVQISTIEHLLSAIYAYGIDNVKISVDADEIPVMDGSSASFCILLDEAGIKEQEAAKEFIRIKKEVIVEDGDKYVKLKPSKKIGYDFSIGFNHPAIGDQHVMFKFNKRNYIEQIAKARTFGFVHEMQYLRSKGLALGASLQNAIGLDDSKVLNPEGLRFDDEFVRHKILDAIGDMSLLGKHFLGEYESFAGSHHLNHLLTVALLKEPEAFEVLQADVVIEKELAKAYA